MKIKVCLDEETDIEDDAEFYLILNINNYQKIVNNNASELKKKSPD